MLTIISLATALAAQPQTPPAPPAPPRVETRVMVFASPEDGPGGLDRNGDGQVSREEFSAPMNDAFGRLDKDSNGSLSAEELAAGHPGPGGDHDMMIMGHPGGPGGLGLPPGPGPHRFEFRTGSDGAVREERVIVLAGPGGPGGPGLEGLEGLEGAEVFVLGGPDGAGPEGHGPGERRIEVRRFGGPGGDGPMGHGPMGHGPMGEGPGMHGPGEMDADGDGKVSEAEFLAPLREAFQRMDVDRSGALEPGENGGERRVHVITRSETRSAD